MNGYSTLLAVLVVVAVVWSSRGCQEADGRTRRRSSWRSGQVDVVVVVVLCLGGFVVVMMLGQVANLIRSYTVGTRNRWM